eukprot:TRINITY_DN679_c0_g1_i1.p1 TRINITY_DN679_c0_g1~~TRINITY_DN679_c0_g1_i1.p1  ORF type:complete len:601 (+),score=138.68 TRINITY_DN679_c0_g1_i1:104-1906(+)
MNRILLLVCFLILGTLATASPKHALFVSIPLPGHILPLLGQGEELLARGWNISFASCDSGADFIRRHLDVWQLSPEEATRVQIWTVGACETTPTIEQVLDFASTAVSFEAGTTALFEWLVQLWLPFYDGLVAKLDSSEISRPSVMIGDIMTHATYDVAQKYDIPLVVNNADEISVLSDRILPPADYVPGLFANTSISSLSLFDRLLYPFLRLLSRTLIVPLLVSAPLNQARSIRSLPPLDLYTHLSSHLVFVNTAFGLEYARVLPPLVQLTGPIFSAREMVGEKLPTDWERELDAAWTAHEAVVLINMGTIARLSQAQVAEISGMVKRLVGEAGKEGENLPAGESGEGEKEGEKKTSAWKWSDVAGRCARVERESWRARQVRGVRVVWKLKDEAQKYVPADLMEMSQQGGRVKIVSRLPSQILLLKHRALAVFVSHCGINSAHESLYFGVPLVCIPLFADQGGMAWRVADSGAGTFFSKHHLNAVSISSSILSILSNSTYFSNACKMGSYIRLAGGAARAADLLELVHADAEDSVVLGKPRQQALSEWQRRENREHWLVADGWDVAVVYVLMLWAMGWMMRKCCCCCCRGGSVQPKMKTS